MESVTELPKWLDDYIFNDLEASYIPRCNAAEYNLEADDLKVKEYLGTYFPRSYGEIFCIAENLFQNECYLSSLNNAVQLNQEINILDIGCGTGGEIVGLLEILDKYLPQTARINVYTFDGNDISIKYMNLVVKAFVGRSNRSLAIYQTCHRVNSEADLLYVSVCVSQVQFDYILCCKVCGELKLKNVIDKPYFSVAEKFSATLRANGIMLILDLTDKPDGCNQYLPREMNSELNSFVSSHDEFGTLVPKPCGEPPHCKANCYMQKQFTIYHSRYPYGNETMVCYRIICRNLLRNQMISDSVLAKKQVIRAEGKHGMLTCCRSNGDEKVDAFDINS